jgi:hypothetical protein
MSIENKRVEETKKEKGKTCFITWKSLFLFLLFYSYSFDKLENTGLKKINIILKKKSSIITPLTN